MAISCLHSGPNDDNGPGVRAQANLAGVPVKLSAKRGRSHNTGGTWEPIMALLCLFRCHDESGSGATAQANCDQQQKLQAHVERPNSELMRLASSISDICSSDGRRWKRLAKSRTFGRSLRSPAVLINAPGSNPMIQWTARSMSACASSG